ncbi:MAG: NADPH-dependent glutamate synthase [Nitrospiraceae bacterium]|nr:NADPH-dependent glutamate synthase [Nitrospiraceae bacterium]MDA8163361.1 NADPH-dependent glutamate synthase [Desulfobacteraceae bacterium]
MTDKSRGKKPAPRRVPVREQDPRQRRLNFEEVSLGYTPEEAVLEAGRCLGCRNRPCVSGCPVGVPIPEFVAAISRGDFASAYETIRNANMLPAVCGRVCPQESQCEGACTLGKKHDALAIGRLERFAADWRMRQRESGPAKPAPRKDVSGGGGRVAVVGSGPSGITCAYELARMGHKVTVFEALHELGGVLFYGIPEFRLPKKIVAAEIETLEEMGVEIRRNAVIGKLHDLEELMEKFDAAFVGTGAGLPRFMGIPGEDLNGVLSANEFLTRTNLMRAYRFPEYDTPIKTGRRVAVIGGGNVAMDSARTALRLGAESVTLVYRRGEEELPARAEEVHHAREEGVLFELCSLPTEITGEDGWANGLKCIRMELCEPDPLDAYEKSSSGLSRPGRKIPKPIEGSGFAIGADTVIVAIGTSANPLLTRSAQGLRLRRGYIEADPAGRTSLEGVFAGGDIVTGSATVISAMGAGRRAARAIHEYIASRKS